MIPQVGLGKGHLADVKDKSLGRENLTHDPGWHLDAIRQLGSVHTCTLHLNVVGVNQAKATSVVGKLCLLSGLG